MKLNPIATAVAELCGGLAMQLPSAGAAQAAVRMTSKNPQQQRQDCEAAIFRREQRQLRNLRNAGRHVPSQDETL